MEFSEGGAVPRNDAATRFHSISAGHLQYVSIPENTFDHLIIPEMSPCLPKDEP